MWKQAATRYQKSEGLIGMMGVAQTCPFWKHPSGLDPSVVQETSREFLRHRMARFEIYTFRRRVDVVSKLECQIRRVGKRYPAWALRSGEATSAAAYDPSISRRERRNAQMPPCAPTWGGPRFLAGPPSRAKRDLPTRYSNTAPPLDSAWALRNTLANSRVNLYADSYNCTPLCAGIYEGGYRRYGRRFWNLSNHLGAIYGYRKLSRCLASPTFRRAAPPCPSGRRKDQAPQSPALA